LKEGALLKGSTMPLPHPRELGANLGFARLPALLALKIAAGRRQDLADVVEILKRRSHDAKALAVEIPERLRSAFLKLAEEARREADAAGPASAPDNEPSR
jgi:hypothetical protein